MPQSYLDAVCREDQNVNRLFCHLHIHVTGVKKGVAELAMPVGEHLLQGGGLVAGGILATLADEAMAHAVMSLLQPGEKCVTAEMNIRYLKSAGTATTETLRARAIVLKRGSRMVVCKAEVFDDRNSLLADSGSTFFVLAPGHK